MSKREVDWKKMGECWKEFFGTTTPETDIICEVGDSDLMLLPAKTNTPGDTFFHMEKVVDFCRVYRLSHFVSWNDDIEKIEVTIYC